MTGKWGLNILSLCIVGSLLLSSKAKAETPSETSCHLQVDTAVIDYGHVSRGVFSDNLEWGELPERDQRVMVTCSAPEAVVIDIEGRQQQSTHFAYGEKSRLNIRLKSLSADGKSVTARVLRNNQFYETSVLQPGDKIYLPQELTSKQVELTLAIEPNILKQENLGVHSLAVQEAITVNLEQAQTQSFTVSTQFSAVACTPSVPSRVVDYGMIHSSMLAADGPTVLPARTLDFIITCDGPSHVAIRGNSNRKNSTVDVVGGETSGGSAQANSAVIAAGLGQNQLLGLPNITEPYVVGLGMSTNGQRIGGYMVNLPFPLIYLDGELVQIKFWTAGLPTASTTWNINTELQPQGDSLVSRANAYFSYGKSAKQTSPSAFTLLTGTLVVQAYITSKSHLDLSSPIQLDGSTNIELFYF